jgi:hypothetical protein
MMPQPTTRSTGKSARSCDIALRLMRGRSAVRFRPLHPNKNLHVRSRSSWCERRGSPRHGLLGRREDVACGRRTRYVLRTLDSKVHPSCINGLKHFFGRSGVALRDAELLERFRPPCTRDCKGFHVNLGFNNGQQMAGARVTICLPFFNDRRQGIVINANKLRDARSYAKSPPGHHFINWAMSMAAACDCRGRFAKCYSGAPSSPLRRNVRFCTLRIILWQLFLAVEILLLPSRSLPRPSLSILR